MSLNAHRYSAGQGVQPVRFLDWHRYLASRMLGAGGLALDVVGVCA
jgi:hypothetical protein